MLKDISDINNPNNTKTAIKICGITNYNDLQTCLDLGFEYIGFNFVERSPRKISIDQYFNITSNLSNSITTKPFGAKFVAIIDPNTPNLEKIILDPNINIIQLWNYPEELLYLTKIEVQKSIVQNRLFTCVKLFDPQKPLYDQQNPESNFDFDPTQFDSSKALIQKLLNMEIWFQMTESQAGEFLKQKKLDQKNYLIQSNPHFRISKKLGIKMCNKLEEIRFDFTNCTTVSKDLEFKNNDSKSFPFDKIVLDVPKTSNLESGIGELVDYDTYFGLCDICSVVIAGGINPHNLSTKLKLFQPNVVDICSGVENIVGQKSSQLLYEVSIISKSNL